MTSKSPTITSRKPRRPADFAPTHPGQVLLKDYLEPMGMSRYALAKAVGVAQIRIGQIVAGRRAITPDTALRLARYFGTSAEFWLGIQQTYDLDLARDRIGGAIEARIAPRAA